MFRGHSVEVLAQILRPTVLKASVLLMTRNGQLGPDIPGSLLLPQFAGYGSMDKLSHPILLRGIQLHLCKILGFLKYTFHDRIINVSLFLLVLI